MSQPLEGYAEALTLASGVLRLTERHSPAGSQERSSAPRLVLEASCRSLELTLQDVKALRRILGEAEVMLLLRQEEQFLKNNLSFDF